ncbi:MAG TPA: MFS transporter [Longimicrobiales bacterium]|nr:MFS transporter [Longimicrobiales bacterium]
MSRVSGVAGPHRPRIFYGWPLVGVAWILYGLQVAGFYSWGFYLPETSRDLSLTRAAGGTIFGVATFCAGAAAPLVGMAITRFGLRAVMTAGFGISALGYLATSRAQSFWQLLVIYGIFTAGTHAFSTVVPTQTLASTWFIRYRARVLAVLLASAGIFAPLIFLFNARLLQVATWRTGWVLIGILNLMLAAIALAFVRNSPEAIGQRPDGAIPDAGAAPTAGARESSGDRLSAPSAASPVLPAAPPVAPGPPSRGKPARAPAPWSPSDGFTTAQALRTPQFFLMVVCGLGYSVPWSVLTNHSRFHLQDLGFELEAAAAILSSMALVSTLGRLSGALGDFLSPPRLLGIALALEGLGCGLFLTASTPARAYAAVILVGLGFGTAFISQAATFAIFFGRRAFATTTGVRFFIGAFFSAFAPAIAGWLYDSRGSYTIPFLGLMALSLTGAAVALVIRAPEPPAATAKTDYNEAASCP